MLGYLDNLVVVPTAIAVTVRMIPIDVMADLRREAETRLAGQRPRGIAGAVVIIAVWLIGAAWIGALCIGVEQ